MRGKRVGQVVERVATTSTDTEARESRVGNEVVSCGVIGVGGLQPLRFIDVKVENRELRSALDSRANRTILGSVGMELLRESEMSRELRKGAGTVRMADGSCAKVVSTAARRGATRVRRGNTRVDGALVTATRDVGNIRVRFFLRV